MGPSYCQASSLSLLVQYLLPLTLAVSPLLLYVPASNAEKNAIDEDSDQHALIDVRAHRPASSLTSSAHLSVSTATFSLMLEG